MRRRGSGPWRAECRALFLARVRGGALQVAFGRRGIWTARGDSRLLRIRRVDHQPREYRPDRVPRYLISAVDPRPYCLTRAIRQGGGDEP